jgi:hypothetical protein
MIVAADDDANAEFHMMVMNLYRLRSTAKDVRLGPNLGPKGYEEWIAKVWCSFFTLFVFVKSIGVLVLMALVNTIAALVLIEFVHIMLVQDAGETTNGFGSGKGWGNRGRGQ